MTKSIRSPRPDATLPGTLSMLTAFALGVSSLLLVSPAMADDGGPGSIPASEVEVTGQESVELNWEDRGRCEHDEHRQYGYAPRTDR